MNDKVRNNLKEELPEPPSEEEFEQRMKNPDSVQNKKNKSKENNVGTSPESAKNSETPAEAQIAVNLENVQKELATKNEKIKEMEDQFLRALAEAQNMRKRMEREMDDLRKYAITSFARDMISVQENLYRAIGSIPEEQITGNEFLKNLFEGVKLTGNDLTNTFKKYGIDRIDPLGQKFDHNFHQAVMEVPDAEKEPGTVVQVMQAGYIIKDRLLRPAMVAVSKKPLENQTSTENKSETTT